ncbi:MULTISPECIES: DUF2339 domain-containing protein [Capnocytophaga]|jgi:putative membrane protein|uniref:DUF2339 domain-containing protein n=1 Tax=Capnocytophaga TaxID=1016 RepID=UPI00027C657A|nr:MULTISPECIES: DUF2339 domain-containing protein [Capnocytophaga]EJU29313.1 membrane protein, PF10101 family [Capnocytophaga sp. CM59]
MSLEDKWASLDKKLDGILRNQSYIIQKVLLMQSQLEQLSTAAPAKGDVPKPKEVFQPVTDKEITPPIEKAPAPKVQEAPAPKEQETPAAKAQEVVTPKAQEVIEKPIQKVAMQAPITPPKAAASASKDTREPVIEWSKLIKKEDWERFIGGNLFNKIGIAIILIGVFIGVKYSIDHDLISPTMRIILGYLTGAALFGVGYYLKPKYEKFSAVLVSGAMAIFYFLTYVAYDFYQMFPTGVAFALMFFVTVATIWFALSYNQQIIALIGMVGGYAVPFLLSNGGGHVWVLLSYVAFINVGILIISFYKQWRWLYHSAFVFTWVLYLTLHVFKYKDNQGLYFSFLLVYYLIFHFAFIVRKLWAKDTFTIGDILILLSNTLLFYSLGLSFTFENVFAQTRDYLTVFTLANALFHFLVYYYTRSRGASKELKYLSLILAISFGTLTIPIYFEGVWITLFWAMEAGGLFWVGRTKKIRMYEMLSYIVLPLATFSLWTNWIEMQEHVASIPEKVTAFLNTTFLNSLLYVGIVAGISYINSRYREKASETFDYGINILLFIVLYATFYIEIYNYWAIRINQYVVEADTGMKAYDSLQYFKQMWLIVYTVAYFALFTWIDTRYIRKEKILFNNLVFNLIIGMIMLTQGLYLLSELRGLYLSYTPGMMYVIIRYIALLAFALLLWQTYKLLDAEAINFKNNKVRDLVLYGVVLWVVSSEWLHWTELLGATANYKLGLSILWVSYGVFMLVKGIHQSKSYMRIASISVILFTLVKLFFYDIAHLSTISRVVVLVILGVLLMIASFLYVKYDKKIRNNDK